MNRVIVLGFLLVALAVSACNALPAAEPTKVPLPPTPIATATTAATATPAPTATPVPPPTSASPLDALSRAFRSFAGAKSFRAKITTTSGSTGGQDIQLDVVMPDRFHMTSKQVEAIIIGPTFYLKTGTQWLKTAAPKGLDFSFADVKKIQDELGATTESKLLGPELLDGTPTLVYQYTTTIKTPTPTTSTSKVWVAVADGLPRKMEVVAKSGTKTTIIYYDYNANITIDPPIK